MFECFSLPFCGLDVDNPWRIDLFMAKTPHISFELVVISFRSIHMLVFICSRKISRDLANTYAKLEKLTVCE